MQHLTSTDSDDSQQGLIPMGLFFLVACASSFGSVSSLLFSDEHSIQRLLNYQSYKISAAATQTPVAATQTPVAEAQTPVAETQYVHSITEHCSGRELNSWENWPQWLLGQFYSPLLRTQNPLWIVAGGKGDCSERSAVLQDLLAYRGVQSRFVGLGGHVVLEAKSGQSTWVLDPDYGISMPTSVHALLGLSQGELANWLVQQGVAQDKSIEYERMLRTTEDNVLLAWNQPLSPRLKFAESVCTWCLWVAPLFCWLGVGWNILTRDRR